MTRRIVSAQPLEFFFTTTMSAMGVPLLLCLRSLLRAILAKTSSLFCQFSIFVELAQHAPQRMEYSGGPCRVVAGHLWTATYIDGSGHERSQTSRSRCSPASPSKVSHQRRSPAEVRAVASTKIFRIQAAIASLGPDDAEERATLETALTRAQQLAAVHLVDKRIAEAFVARARVAHRNDEARIIAVMSSNVDDLLYGSLPERAEAMNSVLQQFLVGKEEHGTFRFCGKEFQQDEDFGIHITAKDNTERVQPITCDAKQGLT